MPKKVKYDNFCLQLYGFLLAFVAAIVISVLVAVG